MDIIWFSFQRLAGYVRISFSIFLVSLLLLMPDTGFAKSEIIYDTETYCRKIAAYGGNTRFEESNQKCMEEEVRARDELAQLSVDTDVMTFCLGIMEDIKLPHTDGSYTILKTCLDSEMEAKQRYR